MRQETGSNIKTASKDIISVRVTMNGDAFVLPEVKLSAEATEIDRRELCVELISKRTMLMPAALLTESESDCRDVALREYAAGGMTLCEGEELLIIEPSEGESGEGGESGESGESGVVALVALSTAMISELRSRGHREVIYDLPLLRGAMSHKRHVILDSVDGVMALKVYSASGELEFADMFECSGIEQVVYWTKWLSEAMSLQGYELYVVRGDASIRSQLRMSFESVNQL